MAQIVVRGIADDVMAAFKARARQRGVSTEQAVRDLIEIAALEHNRGEAWYARANQFRKSVREKYGTLSPSAESIREDRDSR